MKIHTIVLFDLPALRMEWADLQHEKGRRGSVLDARFLRGDGSFDLGVLVKPSDDADIITKIRTLESCQGFDLSNLTQDLPEAVLAELRFLKAKGQNQARRPLVL